MGRDTIHVKAPGNWINDPNGFLYYKGQYHLFYQHFPYAPVWGTMHWGHAVSKDLVNWEHKGIALFPTKYGDQNGCFSGSAVEHEGKMYLFYTGIHYHRPDPENIHRCQEGYAETCQMMIVSHDGERFDNFHGKRTVIPPIEDQAVGDRADTRDPKVWRGRNAWYMVLGSRTQNGAGKLLFYKSTDLSEWSYVNSLSKDGFGRMWECPDYFETAGGKVLLFSPMDFLTDGKRYAEQAVCTVVDFDEETCAMEMSDTWQYFDYGLDLYAPQSTVDEAGRRVVVAWLRMPDAVDGRWNGMFCIPRVVEVQSGHIYFRAHPNVEKAYTKKIASLEEAGEAGCRISLDIADEETVTVGGYRICRRDGRIRTDRSAVFTGCGNDRVRFETPQVKDGWHLDIYVDRHLIEVFVNGGEYVVSSAVYGLSGEVRADRGSKMDIRATQSN